MGEVELRHVEGDQQRSVVSWMFASDGSSRFDEGMVVYFEFALADGRDAQAELDLSTSGDGRGAVQYTETVDGEVVFASDSAVGVVEIARDLDGLLCACAGGRFALRLTDEGPDGVPGTADDAIRELRDGVYRFGEQPCLGSLPDAPVVDLQDSRALSVRPVDHCQDSTAVVAPSSAPATTPARDRSEPVIASEPDVHVYEYPHHDHDLYDPYYHHAHPIVIYDGSQGCGGSSAGTDTSASSSGCGSSEDYAGSSSSGCQGDSSDDAGDAQGCAGESGHDYDSGSDSRGCDGDSDEGGGAQGCNDGSGNEDGASHSSGCEGDQHSSYRQPSAPLKHAALCRLPRRHPLSGAFQNYVWIGFAAVCVAVRARMTN